MDVEVLQCQQLHAAYLVESTEAKFTVLVAIVDVTVGEVVQDTSSEGLPPFPANFFVDKSVSLCNLKVGWIFDQTCVRK